MNFEFDISKIPGYNKFVEIKPALSGGSGAKKFYITTVYGKKIF